MGNLKTDEQIQRTGQNGKPIPNMVKQEPKKTPIPDRKPLKQGQQQLND